MHLEVGQVLKQFRCDQAKQNLTAAACSAGLLSVCSALRSRGNMVQTTAISVFSPDRPKLDPLRISLPLP